MQWIVIAANESLSQHALKAVDKNPNQLVNVGGVPATGVQRKNKAICKGGKTINYNNKYYKILKHICIFSLFFNIIRILSAYRS